MTRPVVVTLIKGNKTTINKAVKGGFRIITYANKITILNKHFPKSSVKSRPLNSVVAYNELPTSTANLNTVSSKAAGILDPGQAIKGFEMFKLIFNTRSLKSLSLGTDLTSNLSSKTNVIVINLLDAVKHNTFTKRSILNNSA
jgi:hypothetical protein